ncbi:MAG: hypothetical protein IPH04_11135 [Saprospirales bacterium]|jgi:hypothetical protein|nr:hypothetical protein [Saprospirales bacterium]
MPHIRILLLFLPLFSLSSCLTIGYQQPQPTGGKNLKEFPSSLIGKYSQEPGDKKADVEVRLHSVIFEDEELLGEGEISLSDTLLLRKYKKFYIVNWYDSKNACWVAHPFKYNESKLYLYSFNLGKDEAESQLSAYTPIVRKGSELLVINPTRKEFKRMLRAGSLWEVEVLHREN